MKPLWDSAGNWVSSTQVDLSLTCELISSRPKVDYPPHKYMYNLFSYLIQQLPDTVPQDTQDHQHQQSGLKHYIVLSVLWDLSWAGNISKSRIS